MGPMAFAMDDNWQMYILGQNRNIVVIDHEGNVIRTVCIGYTLGRAVFDANASVWVTLPSSNALARVSTVDGSFEIVTLTGKNPAGIAYNGEEDTLIVALTGSNTIARIVLSTMAVSQYMVGKTPVDVACGGLYCWAANGGDGTLTRYRIVDWQLSGTFPVGPNPDMIVLDGLNDPWVVTTDLVKR